MTYPRRTPIPPIAIVVGIAVYGVVLAIFVFA